MSGVFLVAHHERTEATSLVRSTTEWLRLRGHEVWMSPADAAALDVTALADERSPGQADLLLSLGGDGTMLRAVQTLAGAPVPIVGVNVGLLGYLAEVEPDGLEAALERWFAGPVLGEWEIEERMMVGVALQRRGESAETGWTALNEAVIEKQEPGHTVRLLVHIDGEPFTSYAADGLIVATPTGSTAYSLSARGPVVSPRHRALLVTPVSPHMLFDRSLVLDPEQHVTIEVLGHRSATLSIDGQPAATLVEGDLVHCTQAPTSAQFVRFGSRRFHQILKAKFGLSDR